VLTEEDYGVPTPEEAARGDIPTETCSVVWCERRDDRAVVLLQVNATPPYFDLSYCERGPNGWLATTSGGGNGDERPEDFADWFAGSWPG
jgi:hypothetical protein